MLLGDEELPLPNNSVATRKSREASRAADPGADIAPLAAAGVPSFGLIQDNRTYFHSHHTPADTLDKVDRDDFRKNVAALAVMGYALADMPDRLVAAGGGRRVR